MTTATTNALQHASSLHVFAACIGTVLFIVLVTAGMGFAAMAQARADGATPHDSDPRGADTPNAGGAATQTL